MVRISIDEQEVYPDYYICAADNHYGIVAEVSQDFIDRYNRIQSEYKDLQEELETLVERGLETIKEGS